MHLQSVMFEILMLTLIFLLKIPNHNYEFRINAKITVHCTFSSDSDEETGEFPIPLKEVRYGAPTLRFLNCNYIYANLPLCEMTAQEKGRESSRPPQAEVFQAAGSLLLLLKRKRRRFFLKQRILKKMVRS